MTIGIEPETQAPIVEAPAKPKLEAVEVNDNYGKFVAEPLERGFGVTLGNALRRVLLNSLQGAAVTAVRIQGTQHEYSTIPDVREDVAELLLNIKGIRLKAHADRPGILRMEIQGPGQVTAGDIQPSADYDIVNPELYLASLDSAKAKLSIDFHVGAGKGYVAAAPIEGMPIGVLPVDAIFTPIRRVNYVVEKTRVGQVTDYERLVFEVTTDGSKSPLEAMREAGQILVESFHQFAALGISVGKDTEQSAIALSIPSEQYNTPIEKLELSARTLNCLKRSKINKVGEVLEKSREELLKIKNFGEKSLEELYERLRGMGFMSSDGEPIVTGIAHAAPEPVAPESAAKRERREPRARGETLRDLSDLRNLIAEEEKAE